MHAPIRTSAETPMHDRPPILTFLLLFVAMLAVVTALAALNDSVATPEQAPPGATPDAQGHPFHSHRPEKASS